MKNTNKQETGLEKFLGIAQASHEAVAERIKYEIKEGNVNPIEILLALKRMSKVVELTLDSSRGDKELKETIHEAVQTSLEGNKSIDIMGANIRIQETGVRYDYSTCNDSYLNKLYELQKIIKENIDQREKEIKTLLPPDDSKKLGIRSRTIIQSGIPSLEFSDDEYEENIFPPIKYGKPTVIVTFKKQK